MEIEFDVLHFLIDGLMQFVLLNIPINSRKIFKNSHFRKLGRTTYAKTVKLKNRAWTVTSAKVFGNIMTAFLEAFHYGITEHKNILARNKEPYL